MAKTSVQMRESIAERLGVLAADMELDTQSADKIDRAYDAAIAELREISLVWFDPNAVPDACEFALTLIVAAQACAKFGKQGQGHEEGDEGGKSRLRSLKKSNVIETVAPDYY